jgi:NAD(P)H-dependent FMN reductase
MKKIVAFGASSSKNSINKKFAIYATSQLSKVVVEVLDLNDYEMPIFSVDKEVENGIHPLAVNFKEKLKTADGFIISFAEHNGAYSAAYKNIYDWVSRIEKSFWGDKPLFLMATSTGAKGGKSVLKMAFKRYNFANDNDVFQFSLPSFQTTFSEEIGIVDEELNSEFLEKLRKFENIL